MLCVFFCDADSSLLSLVKNSIFFSKWSCESGCQWPKSLKSQRVLIGSFQTYLEKSKCPNKSQKLAVLSNLLRRSELSFSGGLYCATATTFLAFLLSRTLSLGGVIVTDISRVSVDDFLARMGGSECLRRSQVKSNPH